MKRGATTMLHVGSKQTFPLTHPLFAHCNHCVVKQNMGPKQDSTSRIRIVVGRPTPMQTLTACVRRDPLRANGPGRLRRSHALALYTSNKFHFSQNAPISPSLPDRPIPLQLELAFFSRICFSFFWETHNKL